MATLYKLDQSNGQRWNYPPFAKRLVQSNFSAMSMAIEMDIVRESLKRLMKEKGIPPTTLSLKVGTNRTLVKDLLEKTNDVSLSTLNKLASALRVPVLELLSVKGDELPNEGVLQIVLTEVLGSSGGIVLPETKLRPVSAHLLLCLQLLAKNPAIQSNQDAVRAVVQAAGSRLPVSTPEA